MSGPVALYVGETSHRRFAPRPHRFRYRLFQILVDIDRIEAEPSGAKLLRKGRMGLLSFTPRDHGHRDGRCLRAWVEGQLEAAGLAVSATRIRLLCFPRVLGFVFNPLSIFFVHGPQDRLEAVIYEVNNTFGQTHAYVTPAEGLEIESQTADKVFFVSPFFRVEGGYRFRLTPPAESFNLSIVKQTGGHPDFVATLAARRRPLTDRALARLLLEMPFMTLGVVAAIHWQALRLLVKGAPFQVRPPGPRASASLGRSIHKPPLSA